MEELIKLDQALLDIRTNYFDPRVSYPRIYLDNNLASIIKWENCLFMNRDTYCNLCDNRDYARFNYDVVDFTETPIYQIEYSKVQLLAYSVSDVGLDAFINVSTDSFRTL